MVRGPGSAVLAPTRLKPGTHTIRKASKRWRNSLDLQDVFSLLAPGTTGKRICQGPATTFDHAAPGLVQRERCGLGVPLPVPLTKAGELTVESVLVTPALLRRPQR